MLLLLYIKITWKLRLGTSLISKDLFKLDFSLPVIIFNFCNNFQYDENWSYLWYNFVVNWGNIIKKYIYKILLFLFLISRSWLCFYWSGNSIRTRQIVSILLLCVQILQTRRWDCYYSTVPYSKIRWAVINQILNKTIFCQQLWSPPPHIYIVSIRNETERHQSSQFGCLLLNKIRWNMEKKNSK